MSQADPDSVPALTAGDWLRRATSLLLAIAMPITACLCMVDIEYLSGCFPVCCLLSLTLAFAVTPMRSWLVFGSAASVTIAIALCAMTIAAHRMRPAEAQQPIGWSFLAFALAWQAPGIAMASRCWRWRRSLHQLRPLRWQFQVRFLLLMTAVLSLAMAAIQIGIRAQGESVAFAGGTAFLILVLGFAFSLFWARHRSSPGPDA